MYLRCEDDLTSVYISSENKGTVDLDLTFGEDEFTIVFTDEEFKSLQSKINKFLGKK